jgi:hypothetical protein
MSDLPVHIKAEHDSQLAEMPGHFNLQLLDFVTERFYSQLVLVLGELFCLFWDTEHQDTDFTVLHLGPKEDSETFKYGIKIGNHEEYIAGTRKCQSYLDFYLTDLQRTKCVTINYENIQEFVSESGCLSCEIEIGREKLDGFVLEEQQGHLEVVSVVGSKLD